MTNKPTPIVAATMLSLWVGMAALPAAATECEPDKLATKYPSLVGKTIKIGTDPETPPYSMRDPDDFNHLIGFDTELAEATFACIGVPIEFSVGSWSGAVMGTVWRSRLDPCWTGAGRFLGTKVAARPPRGAAGPASGLG